MKSKRKSIKGNSGDSSKEGTPAGSDAGNDSDSKAEPSPQVNKRGPKSSAEICQKAGLVDVVMEYTEADYKNLTAYHLFAQQIRPQILQANPKITSSKMVAILQAKFREFREGNPFKERARLQREMSSPVAIKQPIRNGASKERNETEEEKGSKKKPATVKGGRTSRAKPVDEEDEESEEEQTARKKRASSQSVTSRSRQTEEDEEEEGSEEEQQSSKKGKVSITAARATKSKEEEEGESDEEEGNTSQASASSPSRQALEEEDEGEYSGESKSRRVSSRKRLQLTYEEDEDSEAQKSSSKRKSLPKRSTGKRTIQYQDSEETEDNKDSEEKEKEESDENDGRVASRRVSRSQKKQQEEEEENKEAEESEEEVKKPAAKKGGGFLRIKLPMMRKSQREHKSANKEKSMSDREFSRLLRKFDRGEEDSEEKTAEESDEEDTLKFKPLNKPKPRKRKREDSDDDDFTPQRQRKRVVKRQRKADSDEDTELERRSRSRSKKRSRRGSSDEESSGAETQPSKRSKRDYEEDEDEDDESDEEGKKSKGSEKKHRTRRKEESDFEVPSASEEDDESIDEDEEDEDSDFMTLRARKKRKNKEKEKEKIRIPGERKSDRARKSISSMASMTDKEFEKMLRKTEKEKKKQESDSDVEAKGYSPRKHKTRKPRGYRAKRGDWQQPGKEADAESGEESDHYWYCDKCEDGGDLLLCDTCPRSWHQKCAQLEEVPEGKWSCPSCVVGEDDDHEQWCKICKDGGEMILCDFCPCVYHMACLDPPMSALPEGEWKCPRCLVEEPKGHVQQILTWRWREQPQDKDELDHVSPTKKKGGKKRASRDLFIKYKNHSYWDCEWIPELALEVYQPHRHCFFMKKWNLEEPPPLEDGSSYGRIRHTFKNADESDPHNLEQKFYRYGIRPEWLQIERIIRHETERAGTSYLIKWHMLDYSECTWEDKNTIAEPIRDDFINTHIPKYKARRKEKMQGKKNKDKPPKKSKLKKKLEAQPDYIEATGGRLHPYQLEGLNWLRFSWAQDTNTILADEMGLGKTIQAIAFIYSLWKEGYSPGPFIISAPLSTVANWEREFELWAPEMYVVTYVGGKDQRAVIRENEFCYEDGAFPTFKRPCKMKKGYTVKFDVLLTNYELCNLDSATLSSVNWGMIVVDEAHRLKNNQSLFFRTLSDYHLDYKLLMTGTPLQNNLEELFNLLNFLEPDKFADLESFLDEFAEISKEEQVQKLHSMLAIHMLRRVKTDVLKDIPAKSEFVVRIELSDMQKKFYKNILTKNYAALNVKGYQNQTSLMNIMMDLRKCCNHPYLFPAAERDAAITRDGRYEGSALIKACGKLELLQKILKVLKRDKHRVLIFSQMTRVMDILEDFLLYLEYDYERIDGSITGSVRQEAIDRFNSEESSGFVFLLSTKAGGLGINLATADTVIIYDMDWNPHNDIQAFSRAHRIGQRNKVMIYRFVCRNTVEERMTHVAKQKMMLTQLVIRPGMGTSEKTESLSKREVNEILKFGAENLFKDSSEGQLVYDDAAIEKLLDRSQEGPDSVQQKEFGMNEYLTSFKVASYQVKEGANEEEEEEEARKKEEEEKQAKAKENEDYWARVLGTARDEYIAQMEREKEEIARSLGKGKRVRKQVNYATDALFRANVATRQRVEEEEERDEDSPKYLSDYEPDTSQSEEEEEEEEDSESDEKTAKKAKSQEKTSKEMPPLLAKVNGQISVLGFNARQRRAFLDTIMRYGMPPEDVFHTQWLTRDLRGKPERVFRAYVSLFMRHLCEPVSSGADKFSDGVPCEGLSRQHVLTRIGIMALIRKKVLEFEKKNGTDSLAQFGLKPVASGVSPYGTPSTSKDSPKGDKSKAESKELTKLLTTKNSTEAKDKDSNEKEKAGNENQNTDSKESDTKIEKEEKDKKDQNTDSKESDLKIEKEEKDKKDTEKTEDEREKKDDNEEKKEEKMEVGVEKKEEKMEVDEKKEEKMEAEGATSGDKDEKQEDQASKKKNESQETKENGEKEVKSEAKGEEQVDVKEDKSKEAMEFSETKQGDAEIKETKDEVEVSGSEKEKKGDEEAMEVSETKQGDTENEDKETKDDVEVSGSEKEKKCDEEGKDEIERKTEVKTEADAAGEEKDKVERDKKEVDQSEKGENKGEHSSKEKDKASDVSEAKEEKEIGGATETDKTKEEQKDSEKREEGDEKKCAKSESKDKDSKVEKDLKEKSEENKEKSKSDKEESLSGSPKEKDGVTKQESRPKTEAEIREENLKATLETYRKKAEEARKTAEEERKVREEEMRKAEEEKKRQQEELRKKQEALRTMFYIADGGFTELHQVWYHEESLMQQEKEYETWHRRHDFWLLAGTITHGYRHWQEIIMDPRFQILNKPFKTDTERIRRAAFLNRRFQLLEQALVIEEQLQRASRENMEYIKPASPPSRVDSSPSLASLTKLDSLANNMRKLSRGQLPDGPPPTANFRKAVLDMEELVSDVRQATLANLPVTMTRAPQATSPAQPKAPAAAGQKGVITIE